MFRRMKSIPCPSCTAPVRLIQGISSYTCEFCENSFDASFVEAPEHDKEKSDKKISRLIKRVKENLENELYEKATKQSKQLLSFRDKLGSIEEFREIFGLYICSRTSDATNNSFDNPKNCYSPFYMETQIFGHSFDSIAGFQPELQGYLNIYLGIIEDIEDYLEDLDSKEIACQLAELAWINFTTFLKSTTGTLCQYLINLSFISDESGESSIAIRSLAEAANWYQYQCLLTCTNLLEKVSHQLPEKKSEAYIQDLIAYPKRKTS